ncbi:MAG TPA: allophanate hydrolase [Burkholderiales bacterium]|nr:allophanate hydrolase [Burkholderiales bacterium]
MDLSIANLRQRYLKGDLKPMQVVEEAAGLAAADKNNAWIHRLPVEKLREYAKALEGRDIATLPLYGIPFAIKDNIDLAGVPTTAACPEFAYTPEKSATVVQRLIDAGAIPVGKTNLDQFATGLVGARSPYGAGRNSFDPDFVSGGSSSGSAIAVAKGYASFSLGTDTAGSGRVPASFNNLVGLKPTCGLLSATGMVPACRSLDTISIFALTAEEAQRVLIVASAFDAADPFSRKAEPHGFDFGSAPAFRFGVPRATDLEFFGNREGERLFRDAVEALRRLGGEPVEIDLQPFLETARLLYGGPWVAERYAAIREFFDRKPEALFPVTREIVGASAKWLAADAYDALYRLKELKRIADSAWTKVDCIVTPTAPRHYRIAEVEAEPIKLNSNLGHYTNFMNLLDYAAVAIPVGFQADGLPWGVTLFAPAFQDTPLLRLGAKLQRARVQSMGATKLPLPAADALDKAAIASGQVKVAVCGAHMSGLPLNPQLTSRGGRLVATVKSAPAYKFYALPGGPPQRPGMVRAEGGAAIEMEVWELPAREFGSFVAGIPGPLGIGTVELSDGSKVQGFVCEAHAATGATDITRFGGWRAWLASQN